MILPFIPENVFYLIRLFYLMIAGASLSSVSSAEGIDLHQLSTREARAMHQIACAAFHAISLSTVCGDRQYSKPKANQFQASSQIGVVVQPRAWRIRAKDTLQVARRANPLIPVRDQHGRLIVTTKR
ncbi:hypothetical protein [uncultured Sphingomonas sp.]|uniref:hypothetical protein n=1 Tax=uncultured Sphingomonas sp. TaxID=158754 RepID=UPI0030FA1268